MAGKGLQETKDALYSINGMANCLQCPLLSTTRMRGGNRKKLTSMTGVGKDKGNKDD